MDIVNNIFQNKSNQEFKVNKFLSSDSKNKYYEIEFLKTGYKKTVTKSQIKRGYLKDPFEPSVAGVGYLGSFNGNAKKTNKYYSVWHNMLNRCYNPKHREFKRYGELGITVCEEWHNFATFYEEIKMIEGYDEEEFLNGTIYLDKDMKQIDLPKEERIYSLQTCVFLTAEKNNLYADYTEAREIRHAKFIAISPENKRIETSNATAFEREHGLAAGSISRCLNNKIKQAKGWRFEKI